MSLIQLRPAGPNEHRCIIRQALGYYRSLVIGGLYTVSAPGDEFRSQLTKALKHAVSQHPILSAVILDEESEKPRFAKPSHLDLKNHIAVCPPLLSPSGSGEEDDNGDDWRQKAKPLLLTALDTPFDNVDSIPPWKVYYAQLQPPKNASTSTSGGDQRHYLLLFAYDHSHGDGMSALAFHRTLLQGLNIASAGASCPYDDDARCPTTSHALLPTVEVAGRLSVSASYLLSPLLGDRLPRFIAAPLGLRATAIPEAPGSWRGNPTIFHDRSAHSTGLQVLALPAPALAAVLRQCRRRDGVRLTGLLHQLLVRALSQMLPADGPSPARSFVSQTAVDMRRSVPGLGPDDMAVCVTGYYESFDRVEGEGEGGKEDDDGKYWARWTSSATADGSGKEHPMWAAARETTAGLARTASTTRNQPIGLLRFLSDFKSWTLGQLGKPREASYEISNLTAFDPRSSGSGSDDCWNIAGMIFAQPANVTGGCFDVNVVSLKDGDLSACLCWQRGALGVDDEDAFMKELAANLTAWLQELADADADMSQVSV